MDVVVPSCPSFLPFFPYTHHSFILSLFFVLRAPSVFLYWLPSCSSFIPSCLVLSFLPSFLPSSRPLFFPALRYSPFFLPHSSRFPFHFSFTAVQGADVHSDYASFQVGTRCSCLTELTHLFWPGLTDLILLASLALLSLYFDWPRLTEFTYLIRLALLNYFFSKWPHWTYISGWPRLYWTWIFDRPCLSEFIFFIGPGLAELFFLNGIPELMCLTGLALLNLYLTGLTELIFFYWNLWYVLPTWPTGLLHD